MPERETLFTKIAKREIPAEILYEDDDCLAIRDIAPQAPTHVLVVPKRPIVSTEGAADDDALLLGKLLIAVRDVARQLGVAESGYRVVINCGPDGGQTVDHLHLHVLGGRPLAWPPG
ncbi:MAG: histidine triad nucleotide-binding protein [Lacipirellulaceae bacterium]